MIVFNYSLLMTTSAYELEEDIFAVLWSSSILLKLMLNLLLNNA